MKIPKLIEQEEFDRVIKSTSNKEVVAILYILYSTGCRIGSLAALKIEDITNNSIQFHTAKRKQPYVSILTSTTKKAIEEHVNDRTSGYVFSKPKGEKYSTSALRMKLQRELGDNYINPHAFETLNSYNINGQWSRINRCLPFF